MTVDTLEYVKRLEAAGVPRAQAEAHAVALRDEIAEHLVTNADLGAAVDRMEGKIEQETIRLEAKIEQEIARLDTKIDAVAARLDTKIDALGARLDGRIDRLDDKIDASLLRVENTMWKVGLAMLGGGLAIGGLLLRFMR